MSGVTPVRSLSVLADPTRAAILKLMLAADDGRVLVGRTAAVLGLRQPTVSHHMKALLDEAIVTREPAGRRTWYAIAADQRQRVEALLSIDSPAELPEADLARIVDDLTTRFDGQADRTTIERLVADTHALLSMTSHQRLLSSRTAAFAASRLDDLTRRRIERDPARVLFVCVQNAGRSQIAAGVMRQLAGDRVEVRTAGSAPSDDVRASIVTALDEIGIPLGAEFPKPLTDEAVRAADVIVSMGCGDVCAKYPGKSYVDWDVDDPVGRPLSTVRSIRDDIDRRVRQLLRELGVV